jgi:hypothetical protein
MNGITIDINTGDLVVMDGNVVIGDIREQVCEFILLAIPGEIKEAPTLGVNVRSMLSGSYDPFFANRLKDQLRIEKITAKKITATIEEINIEL